MYQETEAVSVNNSFKTCFGLRGEGSSCWKRTQGRGSGGGDTWGLLFVVSEASVGRHQRSPREHQGAEGGIRFGILCGGVDGLRRCLSQHGLLRQHTTDWEICKQQTCISHGPGGWESRLHTALHGGRIREPSGPSYKDTNPIHDGLALMT